MFLFGDKFSVSVQCNEEEGDTKEEAADGEADNEEDQHGGRLLFFAGVQSKLQ